MQFLIKVDYTLADPHFVFQCGQKTLLLATSLGYGKSKV